MESLVKLLIQTLVTWFDTVVSKLGIGKPFPVKGPDGKHLMFFRAICLRHRESALPFLWENTQRLWCLGFVPIKLYLEKQLWTRFGPQALFSRPLKPMANNHEKVSPLSVKMKQSYDFGFCHLPGSILCQKQLSCLHQIASLFWDLTC